MEYNIYINGIFKDRISKTPLKTIERCFEAKIDRIDKIVKTWDLYNYRNIYLIK